MKVAIVVFALLGLSLAAPSVPVKSARDLASDFEDILAHIPVAEFRALALKYVKDDGEFQDVVKYLQGPEWAALVGAVATNPAWIRFKDYMLEAGIDVDALVAMLHDLIAGVEVPPTPGSGMGGLRAFIDECLDMVDVEALLAEVNDKLANSADFQAFYTKISSKEARALFEEIRALPEVQRLADRLREMGVDVDAVVEFIYAFLGWSRKAVRDLASDFEDILAHIPVAEFRALALKYVKDDGEFQDVVKYLQGPEWAALVGAVATNPAWIRFKDYMLEAGIDVDALVAMLHDLIAGVEVPPTPGSGMGGLRAFIDECLDMVDVEALLAEVNDKLANSADFQAFYTKISSKEARALFEEIRALPEVQRLADRLREMGVDVDAVVEFIYAFLGWSRRV